MPKVSKDNNGKARPQTKITHFFKMVLKKKGLRKPKQPKLKKKKGPKQPKQPKLEKTEKNQKLITDYIDPLDMTGFDEPEPNYFYFMSGLY